MEIQTLQAASREELNYRAQKEISEGWVADAPYSDSAGNWKMLLRREDRVAVNDGIPYIVENVLIAVMDNLKHLADDREAAKVLVAALQKLKEACNEDIAQAQDQLEHAQDTIKYIDQLWQQRRGEK